MLDIADPLVAVAFSAFGGVPVTMIWAWLLHRRLTKKYPEEFLEPHRDAWMSFVIGVLERALVTMLVIWVPQGMGAIVGALIIVKAAGSWSLVGTTSLPGRVRYFTALLGSLMSVAWGLAWGIVAIHAQP